MTHQGLSRDHRRRVSIGPAQHQIRRNTIAVATRFNEMPPPLVVRRALLRMPSTPSQAKKPARPSSSSARNLLRRVGQQIQVFDCVDAYPDSQTYHVSHEHLRHCIFAMPRGELRKET